MSDEERKMCYGKGFWVRISGFGLMHRADLLDFDEKAVLLEMATPGQQMSILNVGTSFRMDMQITAR